MNSHDNNLEIKFKGKIEHIFDGAALDAESYMIVAGKKVYFNAGIWGSLGESGIRGEVIGIDLSGDLEGKKYIGKTAEVYAVKESSRDAYTLQGSTKYYIKLVK